MMSTTRAETSPLRAAESEKITVNLGCVDLGHIDLLVAEGVYGNRSDFIRTAIRNQINRHTPVTRQSILRRNMDIGLRRITRAELETVLASGQRIAIKVLGLASFASDITPDLVRETVASLEVLGTLQATPSVKTALADRML